MSYEFILAPRSDCEDWKKKRRRGVRSFVYLKVRPWESGWLPFTLGWQMGKTFVDKNCSYLPSVSPLLLETAPSLPCYYGYHRSQHSGTAQRHTVVTADWSRSIHPTPAEPIKPHPPVLLDLREKRLSLCRWLHFHSMEKWRKSVCRENAANNRGIGSPHGLLVPGSRGFWDPAAFHEIFLRSL